MHRCASRSEDVGRTFVEAGVPYVIALRGFLPEDAVSTFVSALYRELFTGAGATPRAAFDVAVIEQVDIEGYCRGYDTR